MSDFEADKNIRELHRACVEGHKDIVNHLLKQKVRASAFDLKGHPPIVVAAVNGNASCVRLLCENQIRVDQPTKNSDTALTLVLASFVAANTMPVPGPFDTEKHVREDRKRRARNARLEEVVVTLLELGADPATPRHSGITPLHIASLSGFNSAVQLLLSGRYYTITNRGERVNPSVHAVDALSRTPLHRAAAKGHGDVAATLLRAGADPLARNSSGMSSLQVGIELGRDVFIKSVMNTWCEEFQPGVHVNMDEMMQIKPALQIFEKKIPQLECLVN